MINEIKNFKQYLAGVIPIDDGSFEIALQYLQVATFSKGEHLVREGQVYNKVAFINEGLFRIYYLKDGTEINTCFCKENSITSAFDSFVNQVPSKESIQALEDSVVVTLSSENLAKLVGENAIWQTVRQLLTEKECLRLSGRAASLSFEPALEKYRNLFRDQPEIIQRVPVQHIASYLGVSRETLSRIRARVGE